MHTILQPLQSLFQKAAVQFGRLQSKLGITRLQALLVAAVVIVLSSFAVATGVQHYATNDLQSNPADTSLASTAHKKIKPESAAAISSNDSSEPSQTSSTTTTTPPAKKPATSSAPSPAPAAPNRGGTIYGTPRVTLTASVQRLAAPVESSTCNYTVTLKATAENTPGESTAGVRLTLLTTHDDGPSQTNKSETYTYTLAKGETKYFSYNHSYYKGQNGTTVRAKVQYASLGTGLGTMVVFTDTTPTNPNSTDFCW